MKDTGIQRRTSTAYTPQQNGVAERKNRTLMEMVRCLLIQSGLPASFWGEALRTANYTRNRCVSRSLDGRTPYEAWHGRAPNVAHMRRFGERAMILAKRPGQNKLAPKAYEGIFVGYSGTSKAWRFYVLHNNMTTDSRDAEFLGTYLSANDVQREVHPDHENEEVADCDLPERTVAVEILQREEDVQTTPVAATNETPAAQPEAQGSSAPTVVNQPPVPAPRRGQPNPRVVLERVDATTPIPKTLPCTLAELPKKMATIDSTAPARVNERRTRTRGQKNLRSPPALTSTVQTEPARRPETRSQKTLAVQPNPQPIEKQALVGEAEASDAKAKVIVPPVF